MNVQYQDPEKADMINGEWRSPKCDAQGRLIVTAESAGSDGTIATSAKQDEQTDLLEKIDLSTRIGAGWFLKRTKKLVLADMTPSGIDLAALTPAGMTVVGVAGSRTTVNGTVIDLEATANDVDDFIDLNFGANFTHYGVWKKIGPLTSSGCFPLYVLFA